MVCFDELNESERAFIAASNKLRLAEESREKEAQAIEQRRLEDLAASRRVVRGGSWINYPQDLRLANRYRYVPTVRFDVLGFRIGRSLPNSSPMMNRR